ncbi:MAG: ubiquinone/menaquinone biosynthesis methyltransferase [Anaerolineaceae bacterium]
MKPMLTGNQKASYVHGLFARVATNYERMNQLMTAGQDRRWRKEAIWLLQLKCGQSLLDVGTGTGDLAREALRQQPDIQVAAADFTWQMMSVGNQRGKLPFVTADGLTLPFRDHTFDGVVSGFLLRNVGDVDEALAEQYRVLKPGGRIVILETTPPSRTLLTPFIWMHMHLIIPLLGSFVSGVREAYEYLPNSSEQFLKAEELAERLSRAGFVEVGFKRLMAGTIALHWGKKL